jgi:hypothetical protein
MSVRENALTGGILAFFLLAFVTAGSRPSLSRSIFSLPKLLCGRRKPRGRKKAEERKKRRIASDCIREGKRRKDKGEKRREGDDVSGRERRMVRESVCVCV